MSEGTSRNGAQLGEATAELERIHAALRTEIEERARRAEDLQRAVDELGLANRRKDELLSVLGHELRNTLAPIVSAAEALRMTAGASPQIEKSRLVIERQAKNLTRIIDDLLNASRLTRHEISLHPQPVQLRVVVASAVEAARPLIAAGGHTLEVHLPPGPVALLADPTRFEEVLVNLLNNAATHSEPGGHITLTGETDEGHVTLRVRDTGAGIGPALLPHVFELFVQGQPVGRSRGGLGIGLALVKSVVELHGGTVEVRSDGPGRGTEVTVRVPFDPAEHDAPPPASMPAPRESERAPSPAGEERRVLVVEDNPDVAAGMTDLLDIWGYRTQTVGSGEDAVRAALAMQPHAVIVDVGLPGIDGFEVARRLRRLPGLGERLLLIGASGYGQEQDRRRAEDAGFDSYLVKPMSMDKVHELLAAHCAAHCAAL